jgi:hypothetical protein
VSRGLAQAQIEALPSAMYYEVCCEGCEGWWCSLLRLPPPQLFPLRSTCSLLRASARPPPLLNSPLAIPKPIDRQVAGTAGTGGAEAEEQCPICR